MRQTGNHWHVVSRRARTELHLLSLPHIQHKVVDITPELKFLNLRVKC